MVAIGPHGHPTGYRRNCDQCKAERAAIRAKKLKSPAYRAYRAQQRRDERAARFVNLVALPVVAEIGPNEQATVEQCGLLAKSEVNPATVQHARTLSKILDNPEMAALWPRTARDIQALLLPLDAPKTKGRKKLAAIISMTDRKPRKAAQ